MGEQGKLLEKFLFLVKLVFNFADKLLAMHVRGKVLMAMDDDVKTAAGVFSDSSGDVMRHENPFEPCGL